MAMTWRQKILKRLYPVLIWLQQKSAKKKQGYNKEGVIPPVPFHSLSVALSKGTILPFEALRGKKVLLVNTASNCGYTAQYAELQKLYRHSKDDLEIIAFPANDFKEQEKGTDEEIAGFCSINYGVSFPVGKKAPLKKARNNTPFTDGYRTGRRMGGTIKNHPGILPSTW